MQISLCDVQKSLYDVHSSFYLRYRLFTDTFDMCTIILLWANVVMLCGLIDFSQAVYTFTETKLKYRKTIDQDMAFG